MIVALDQITDTTLLPPEEEKIIRELEETHQILEDGHYYGPNFPAWTIHPSLESLEVSLSRDVKPMRHLWGKKLQPFQEAMHKYLTLDHAEKVPAAELHAKPQYYLPMHVFKDSSSTTKIQPMFNASA